MKYKHVLSFIFILIIFFQFNFNPYPAFSSQDIPLPSEKVIRVVSYNIRFGASSFGDQDISKISRFLSSLEADIICLQEVDKRTIRSFLIDQPEKLKKDLFMEIAFGETGSVIPGKTGNLVLSKFPIINIENTKLPSSQYPRSLLKITVDTPHGNINIINSHLSLSKTIRKEQIKLISEEIAHESIPTILAGDFNTSDIKEIMPLLSLLVDSAVITNKNNINTFINKKYNSRIDYVLVSENFLVKSYNISTFDTSDHFPVIVDILIE